MKTTPDNITELKDNEVFVFGSNLSGIHGGGAARTAMKWGAEWGNPSGLQGNTYAIPTKSHGILRTLTLDEIAPYVTEFILFAKDYPEKQFLVTEIGCGLAGLDPKDVAPLFLEAWTLPNVSLPKKFQKIRAWYFSNEDKKLRYGDDRPIEVGVTHDAKAAPLELCAYGLHASQNILHALQYAPGHILWEVELGGKILVGDDKMCATHRTYLREINCEEILREFARWCALQVIHLWDCPSVAKEYLETGNPELREAAWDAAWDAARDAWDAAWDAARDAAWDAARDAAWAAARDAARAAAWAAAREATAAARAAARDAARDAWEAGAGQEIKLLSLINNYK